MLVKKGEGVSIGVGNAANGSVRKEKLHDTAANVAGFLGLAEYFVIGGLGPPS